MEEAKVNYETALLAKVLGFDEICYFHFGLDGIPFESRLPEGSKNSQWVKCVARPTHAFLQKWLREVHNIHVFPVRGENNFPSYCICVMYEGTNYHREDNDFTYEESMEIGLLKGLKLIKIINV